MEAFGARNLSQLNYIPHSWPGGRNMVPIEFNIRNQEARAAPEKKHISANDGWDRKDISH